MINAPDVAPVYTGQYVYRPNGAFQPAPIPSLPAADFGSATNSGQPVIMWPMPPERRPLDEFLGNFRGGLHCSSAVDDKEKPVCHVRLQAGSVCVSSNQCYADLCQDFVCQPGQQDNDDDRDRNNNNNRNRNND
jgi:hypothetical protein